MMTHALIMKPGAMITNIKRESSHSRELSDLEEIELLKTLSLLKTTLDVFPADSVSRQEKINEWAKLEQWCILAIKAISGLVKQLAPIQSRSTTAEQAFGATLIAYDALADVVEQRFKKPDPQDFGTAKQAVEQCLATAHRLV